MGYTHKSLMLGAVGGILIAMVIISATYTYFTYGSGRLLILVADPPKWGDATHVYIRCSKIEVHRASESEESGWFTVIEDPGWINLTEVLETSEALGEANLQAGKYNLVRFDILEAKATVNSENRTAEVPSGKLQIVITEGGVTVKAGQTTNLLIDFETQVTYTHGKGHKLTPTIKVIPMNHK